jgi:hypothetical protein
LTRKLFVGDSHGIFSEQAEIRYAYFKGGRMKSFAPLCKGCLSFGKRKALCALVAALAVLLLSPPLFSQLNTGRISGAITDQSSGAVAGAKVAVTEVATGIARSLTADGNNTVYYGGVSDPIMAFPLVNAKLASPTSLTGSVFGYPGVTPGISADGTSNGILWAVENSGTAVLHAYNATNLSSELYNSNQAANSRDHFGAGNKFMTPTIANGRVYVGTPNGVAVFSLLP